MEQNPNSPTPSIPPGFPAGFASNEGREPYQLEAESTTGFVAWKLAEGETIISGTTLMEFRPTLFISFWACAGFQDTTPAGHIRYFDCHGCGITRLDVRALTGLEMLDASFNRLKELPLTGLDQLEGLDVEGNELTELDLRSNRKLRVLNCASNKLRTLNISGLHLPVLDITDNRLLEGFASSENRKGNSLSD